MNGVIPKTDGTTPESLPPRPHPPEFGNIPPQLKALRRWLCWRFSEAPNKQGRFGKVPYGITDRKADYTNPAEWQPFETVVRQYHRGTYDGIGLVLGGGLCGLDEDHCVQDGSIHEESARHIQLLNSYSEFSVSDDGVHCLAFGKLPDGLRKRGNHELYADQRYFVVTGRRLPSSPLFVEHREKELKQLHAIIFGTVDQNELNAQNQEDDCPQKTDVAVPKTAPITQGGGEGGLFSDERIISLILKDPVAQVYWPSCPTKVNPSEADFALACKLAFYCRKDLPQMERLFRRSGLAIRAKAATRRGDQDYITYTLKRACEKQEEIWQPGRRTKSPNPPGRPRCGVDPQQVVDLRSAGQSWRAIARELSIGKTTAERLYNGHSSVPKPSQNPEVAQVEAACPIKRNDAATLGTGIPWAEWKAAALNRLFLEQGITGKPGHITAATVRHGERKWAGLTLPKPDSA